VRGQDDPVDGGQAGGGVRPPANEAVPARHEPGAAPGGQDRVQGDPEGGVPHEAGQPTPRQEAHHDALVHQAQFGHPLLRPAAVTHSCRCFCRRPRCPT
jgi:hypothetical protein